MARFEAIFKNFLARHESTGAASIVQRAPQAAVKQAAVIAEFDMDGTLCKADDKFLKLLPALIGLQTSDITLRAAMQRISATPVTNAEGMQVGFAIQWLDQPQELLTEAQVSVMLGDAVDEPIIDIEHQSARMARYAAVEAARDGGCEPEDDRQVA